MWVTHASTVLVPPKLTDQSGCSIACQSLNVILYTINWSHGLGVASWSVDFISVLPWIIGFQRSLWIVWTYRIILFQLRSERAHVDSLTTISVHFIRIIIKCINIRFVYYQTEQGQLPELVGRL